MIFVLMIGKYEAIKEDRMKIKLLIAQINWLISISIKDEKMKCRIIVE